MAIEKQFKNYKVKFGSLGIASFSEISALVFSSNPIEYRNGDYEKNMRSNNLIKNDNVTFKNGMTDSKDIITWIAKLDTIELLTIEISLFSDDQKTPQAVWIMESAFPIKYSIPDLKSEGIEVVIVSLQIACGNFIKRK